ncbi:MAG: dihydrofolate reductase family protein, partial [Candidatus Nitrosocosmicus sp.]
IIKNNLFDKLIVTISPMLIGGQKAVTLIEGKGFDKIKDCKKLEISNIYKRNNGEIIVCYTNPTKTKLYC